MALHGWFLATAKKSAAAAPIQGYFEILNHQELFDAASAKAAYQTSATASAQSPSLTKGRFHPHPLIHAVMLAALAFPAIGGELLQIDPWKALTTAELWDTPYGDGALRSAMRQLETENTKRPLQLAQLLEQLLVKNGESPKWSMASEAKQIKWLGAPSMVNGKTYRLGFGIIGADKITPTRLVDKEYAKSWILTMSGTGGMRFGPTKLDIEMLAVFNQGQGINKMPGNDLPKHLKKHGLQVKTECLDSGTQHEVAHFVVENKGRSLHLLYAYTAGTGQESLSYLVRWGDIKADCKNLADFGMS